MAEKASLVHLWLGTVGSTTPADDLLSTDERERAARFVYPRDRDRFVAARSLLRRVLGAWLDAAPADLTFAYTDFGKPFVPGAPDDLAFNLSHSGDAVLVGVLSGEPIGVDIEALRPLADMPALARTVFTAAECAGLEPFDDDTRSQARFYRQWTRKEAVLKALGRGFSIDPKAVEIGAARSDPVIVEGHPIEGLALHDVDVGPGFAACVATFGDPVLGPVRVVDACDVAAPLLGAPD